MRRSLLILLLSPVLAVTAMAGVGHQGASADADDPARGLVFAGLRRVTADGPCRYGYRLSVSGTTLCSHGPDAAPPGVDVRQQRGPEPAQAASTTPVPGTALSGTVQCYGNGSDGYRVQLIYAHASGKADRFSQFAASFASWAGAVDSVFSGSAGETGGVRHVRFVNDSSCNPVVLNVPLSASGDDNLSNTISELRSKGYNRTDRKYMVWMDANVYCGIAQVYYDDQPGQGNASNGSSQVAGEFARVDNGCWGASGQSVEAHELMHTLGGVQTSAPHSTPYNHCFDESDRMCYSDGSGVAMKQICATSHENRFDCNHDDYFFAGSPASGNYLATHWNTANSVFLAGGGSSPPPPPPNKSAPSAPRSLVASLPASGHGVVLTWQAPANPGSSPVTGYKIFRSRSTTPYALTTVGNVLTFTNANATPGVGYYYWVKAVSADGTSAYSNRVWKKAK